MHKKVKIIVDNREPDEICDYLESLGAEIELAALPFGDYHISEKLIAERKTRSDFEASIIDGRLFSQIPELCRQAENILIIIEGEPEYKSRLSRAALLGAYSSLISDFGCSLFFTKSLYATADLLFALAKHEQLAKNKPLPVYAKKKARSLSDQQLAVIEALPNVGPTLARALLSYFTTVENVITAPESELMEVGKIGKKKAEAIRKLLTTRYKKE